MRKTIAIILCFMILMANMPLTVFGAEKISAKLIQMEGDVQVIRAGGEKPFKAFVNMRLTEGDRIITGPSGKAKIEMDDEVIITLAENTRIYLSELRGSNGAKQSSINLQSGGVGSSVKEKLKDNSRFEIKTPTAVMGVRGTEFFTQYYNGNVDVRVVDGIVEVTVNVTKEGDVTGVSGTGARTYTFPISALQQVAFSEGEDAKDVSESVGALDLDGLPIPFLDRIREINEEDPDAIPKEILDSIDKAVENAIKTLKEKMENKELVPDEIASSLETTIAGNIQQSTPTIIDPPTSEPRGTSRRDSDDDRDDGVTMCELTLCGGGGILDSEYEGKDAAYTTTGYYMPYASECTVEYIPKGTEVKINITPPLDDYTRVALLVDEEEIKKGDDIEESPVGTNEEYFYTFQILKDTKIEGLFDKYRVTFDEETLVVEAYKNENDYEPCSISSGEFVKLEEEEQIYFTATPDEENMLIKWKVNGEDITENDDYYGGYYIEENILIVEELMDDIYVEVEFEEDLSAEGFTLTLTGELEALTEITINLDINEEADEDGNIYYTGIEEDTEIELKFKYEPRAGKQLDVLIEVGLEQNFNPIEPDTIDDNNYTYIFTIIDNITIRINILDI